VKTKKEQLIEDGYCLVENVLTPEMLEALRVDTDRLTAERLAQDLESERSTGSMIHIFDTDLAPELITYPAALGALHELGYNDPKFSSGYIISKPPKSPRLFWHYDWACWDDPGAFDPIPQQLFLMYYLVDTKPENGCLRVVPGSHLHDNPLHDIISEAHTAEIKRADDLNAPEFSTRPDEVDVCVKAGDLVIGDSRILHAAHTNESDERRTVLTLWYHPCVDQLHEGTQGFLSTHPAQLPEHWSDEHKAAVEAMLVKYDGKVDPLPWNRIRPNRSQPSATS
jgi:hypothetical protein